VPLHPALGDLYAELAPQLLRYAQGILGSRADAEEAVQDAFLAAASAVPLDEPRRWLFRVTRNAAIDQLRRRRRHLAVLDGEQEPARSPDSSPQDRAELADDLRVLRDGIDRLPEQQRSALMLRELGGLHYREIADVVDVSEANVKVLIFRARRSLQEFADAVRLPCDEAQMTLSAHADREAGKAEVARARLHTATCSGCRAFTTAIRGQRTSLAVLVPLVPVAGAASGALLTAAASAGAKAGGGLGGFFGMKTAATAAAVVVVGTGAVVADHEGIGLRRGGEHKPVPVKVDRAIVPSDPQPALRGGNGGGGGAVGGAEEDGGGGLGSGPGSSEDDRPGDEDHSGSGGGGEDRGEGGRDDRGSGSDSSGTGSGDEPDDEPHDSSGSGKSGGGGSDEEEPDTSGSGSGKSGSGSDDSGSGSGSGRDADPDGD